MDTQQPKKMEIGPQTVNQVVAGFPPLDPKPASYLEWKGVGQMTVVLVLICLIVGGFVVGWALTVPTLEEAQALAKAGNVTDPTVVVSLLGELQSTHTTQFKEMFQLLVMSGLVPLFTLLAGYVFGRGKAAGEAGDREDEES